MNESSRETATYIEEDEIDLRELFQTILKGKKVIALISTVVVTLA